MIVNGTIEEIFEFMGIKIYLDKDLQPGTAKLINQQTGQEIAILENLR